MFINTANFFISTNILLFLLLLNNFSNGYVFTGKKALVTGSSGGIGAEIAKELAKKGCRVMIHYNSRYEEWDGEIDILVNNAGLITKLAAEDEDDDFTSWMDTIQVNLNAPYQLSKLAYDRMKKKKHGNIINVSSIHGSVSCEYMVAYASSKAALDRMTAGLSSEWARNGVRVNSLAPGIVPVERTQDILSQQSIQDLWHPHLPVGRMGTTQECAHAVVYLLENEWTSGSILTLDGGMTARINMPFRPKPEPQGKEKESITKGASFEK